MLPAVKERLTRIRSYQERGHHMPPLATPQDDDMVCTCLNCGTAFRGNYCPQCGQKATTGRLGFLSAIEHMLGTFTNMERGFVHTSIELFYRPGYMMRDYVEGKRSEYSRPLSMLFLLATLQLVIHYIFYQNFGYQPIEAEVVNIEFDFWKTVADKCRLACNYLIGNQALMTLLFTTFLVIPNWLIFKFTRYGRRLNIVEHFFIMLYVGCQLMLVNIVQIPYNRLFTGDDELIAVFSSHALLFMTWDFHQLFSIGWRRSFFYMLLSFFLQLLFFIVLLVIVVVVYLSLFDQDGSKTRQLEEIFAQ